MKNNLQQLILNVIEEMDSADAYGTLPSASIPSGNVLYNQDTYSKGYHGIPFKSAAVQKRNFPELINTKSFNKKPTNFKPKKAKLKKIKHGKQK
jgi:hypothetical protein